MLGREPSKDSSEPHVSLPRSDCAGPSRSATIAWSVPSLRPTSARLCRTLSHAAAWAGALFGCAVALAAGPPYRGRPVAEVLRELGAHGLRLIYSSETVPTSLEVLAEPAGNAPLEVLPPQ